jgi:hypothetical protein
MAVTVIIAVYGGLRDGDPDKAEAKIVTGALQAAINKTPGQVVKIDNKNMGEDPAKRVEKQFAAIVDVNGKLGVFACKENQTIDFTSG